MHRLARTQEFACRHLHAPMCMQRFACRSLRAQVCTHAEFARRHLPAQLC